MLFTTGAVGFVTLRGRFTRSGVAADKPNHVAERWTRHRRVVPPIVYGLIVVTSPNAAGLRLQGIYPAAHTNLCALYAPLRNAEPIAVLGGSIYLFDFDAKMEKS